MTDRLRRLFWPSSIAVVGASPDLSGFGGQILDMLLAHGFDGRVVPVNPKHREIGGLPAVPSVSSMDEPVDLALIVVPAPAVLDVVRECAAAGVAGVAIFSSGFAEQDAAGAARQDEVLAVARAAGMRVLGPNCQGFFNLHGSVAATFSPAADPRRGLERALPGNVAVVSQSGALGFALFNSGTALGMGFSHVVSCGNGTDVDVLDIVELLLEDEATDVMLLVLEGLADGSRFRQLATRAAEGGTRLVVSKLGRSDAGARAAASHTAHLAGSGAAYDAVFKRHGVLRAADLEELVDVGMALARCDRSAGPRVGIVSTSGGAGIWLADACDEIGLEVPEVGDRLREALGAIVPPFAGVANPLDLTGAVVRQANVAATVRAFVEDPGYDVVLLATSLSDPLILDRERTAFAELAAAADKPIMVLTYTRPSPASVDLLAELSLPWATSPARVARMVDHLVQAGRTAPPMHPEIAVSAEPRPSRGGVGQAPLRVGGRVPASSSRTAPATHVAQEPLSVAGPAPASFANGSREMLNEPEAKRLLQAWGVAVPDGAVAGTPEDAARIAETLGEPVAMKVVSSVAHKSDLGGVTLDVEPARAASLFDELVRRVTAAAPDISIDGVLVERMAASGHEVIVGALRDETFGPLVMVGSGGVDAELLADTRFMPLPLDQAEATRAIEALRCAPVLAGARGRPVADVPALAELLVRVAALAEQGEITELDLNPVLVHEAGKGVTVLDAWVRLQ